jgi:hypothetical protein
MHTGGGRAYMRQKLAHNLQMGIPVCIRALNGGTCGGNWYEICNVDPLMRNDIVCRKIADTSQTDLGTHTGTPRMRTGRKTGNFAYGESQFA